MINTITDLLTYLNHIIDNLARAEWGEIKYNINHDEENQEILISIKYKLEGGN